MLVRVDLEAVPAVVTAHEVDDLTRLHVAVHGGDEPRLDTALRDSGLGSLENGHAVLDAERLRRLAGTTVAGDWGGRFDAMIDYARSKGFVGADGRAVRAHLQWE